MEGTIVEILSTPIEKIYQVARGLSIALGFIMMFSGFIIAAIGVARMCTEGMSVSGEPVTWHDLRWKTVISGRIFIILLEGTFPVFWVPAGIVISLLGIELIP